MTKLTLTKVKLDSKKCGYILINLTLAILRYIHVSIVYYRHKKQRSGYYNTEERSHFYALQGQINKGITRIFKGIRVGAARSYYK